MTQTAFSHFFKREVGHSFSSWLEIVRVARAVELLRDTDMTVSRIAFELGYQDPDSLSRVLRRRIGLGARALRRHLR
jgi:transcriptional regulator GlxA family with amidase domain